MNINLIYEWILQLYSLWAILTLTIIFYTILRFFFKAYHNKVFKSTDLRVVLFGLIFSNIQFVIGAILYFLSPKFSWWQNGIEQIFQNEEYFFYLVKRPFLIVLAILSITIGWSLFKKAKTEKTRFVRLGIFNLIGFLLLLAAISF